MLRMLLETFAVTYNICRADTSFVRHFGQSSRTSRETQWPAPELGSLHSLDDEAIQAVEGLLHGWDLVQALDDMRPLLNQTGTKSTPFFT